MTVLYQVHAEFAETHGVFPLLRHAKAVAREMAAERGFDVEVTRCVVAELPARQRACALLNREGWCNESEVVFVAKAKGR